MVEERSRKSIGVFDSGIGGLTVVRALMKRLPHESIIYFGDTARVPYGSKSAEVVKKYALEDAEFLVRNKVKLIVVACNTASSVAMDVLRERFDIPLIGMIEPGSRKALQLSKVGRIGVIGTLATIASGSYRKEIHSQNPSVTVIDRACPLFVPLAEEGWIGHRVSRLVAEEYLSIFRDSGIDTLILGCTHYPILRSVIQDTVGESVKLVDSGDAAAEEIEKMLADRGEINPSEDEPNHVFYVSDVPQRFKELGRIFLGTNQMHVKKVSIPEE
ncbi:MAG: glutamate racemase [Bacteroidota bacterium]|nr:glutamate racemase [Bacteroidota bacterium]